MPESPKQHIAFNISTYSDMRCPMHGMLNLLMGPWTTYILWLIRTNGQMRFGQFKKQIPRISSKVLTERLRMLEEAGIVFRRQENTIPLRVSYSFTARGNQLESMLDQINALAIQWSSVSSARIEAHESSLPFTTERLEKVKDNDNANLSYEVGQ